MTDKEIEKAAEYANGIIDSFGNNGVPCGISDIRKMIAEGFIDGAKHALSHQWVSVEDRLPEYHDVCVFIPKSDFHPEYFTIAKFDGEDWYETTSGHHIRPTHWMLIPTLPEE